MSSKGFLGEKIDMFLYQFLEPAVDA